jgi:peptide/nickel transport system substrate-binding protein
MTSTCGTATRRTLRLLGVLLALLLMAAACGGSDDDETAADGEGTSDGDAGGSDQPAADLADAVRGGEIVVGIEAETAGWDPPNGLIGFPGRMVNWAIYSSLTAARPDGTYAPYLADSLTANDDATEWTIGLREGMTFHDGTAFDAEAVKFSMDRVRSPDAAVGTAFAYIDSIDVVDDLTLTITLNQAQARMPEILSDALGNITSPTAVEELGAELNNAPVGAGPYRFVEWVRDDHLTVERFEDFFRDDTAWADRIVFRPILDNQARSAALLAGDLDVMVTQAPSEIQAFRENDAFVMHEIPFGATGVYFNVEQIDDLRVRQAVAHAIDKPAFIELVWRGVGDPVAIPIAEDSPWFKDVDTPSYDPEAAMALVEEYESDTGEQATVELLIGQTQEATDFGAALQDQLGQVGIDVVLDGPADPDTIVQRLIEGNFQAAIGNHGGLIDPWFEYTRRYTGGGFLNFTRFNSPEIDENLRIGATSTDDAEREVAYDAILDELAAGLDAFYIRSNIYAVVHVPEISGFMTATNPDGSASFGNFYTPILMDELWRTDG